MPNAPLRAGLVPLLTAMAALPVLAPVATAAPEAPAAKTASDPGAEILARTNDARADAGCKPLKRDAALERSASSYARSMAASGKFSHTGADGSDFTERGRKAGARSPGGENIAQGQDSAREVMADWMESPGHRRNILDCSFTTLGVGHSTNGDQWVQEFGR